MTDQVWIKFLDTVPITLTAIGSTYAAIRAYQNGKKADTAATHAASASDKLDTVQAQATQIASQTDGQLDKMRAEIKRLHEELLAVHRENAGLREIVSAREKKPAGEAVRYDDEVAVHTHRPAPPPEMAKKRRRATDK